MADWDVPGFMKLEFGHNAKGATYYIDNFTIRRDNEAGLRMAGDVGVIENFNKKMPTNQFGKPPVLFSGHGGQLEAAFQEDDARGKGYSLGLSYDVQKPEAFAGYQIPLSPLDIRDFELISLFVRSEGKAQDLSIGLKDRAGNESWVSVKEVSGNKIDESWHQVDIPLAAFSKQLDRSGIDSMTLAVSYLNATSGKILVDEIELRKDLREMVINDFERNDGKNRLAKDNRTVAYGAAAINGFYTTTSPNRVYGLAYGGNIGDGFLNGYGLSYSYWRTELGGIDCTQCENLLFKIKAEEQGELPNIYLGDGNTRWGLSLSKYIDTGSSDWQNVKIPLADYEKYGVDLTHLDEMDVVFEWEPMSGTLYIDDIRLGQ